LKKRLVLILSAVAAVVLIVVILGIVAARQRVARHRVFRAAPAQTPTRAPEPPQHPYLRARMLIERNEPAEAAKTLAPFLAAGNPFRDLALYHQAEIDDALGNHEAASRDRQALIFGYPSALYRDQAIDDEVEYLMTNPQRLSAFAQRIPSHRRDLDAHLAEAFARAKDWNSALSKALGVLAGGTVDDPSERAARVLDRAELLPRLTPPQKVLLGTAMQ